MNKLKFLIILIFLSVHCSIEARLPTQLNYVSYYNVRFQYAIDYPKGLLIPQGESDNSDGQIFKSADNSIHLRVWGSHGLINSIKTNYENSISDFKQKYSITYSLLKDNYFVITGKNQDNIFYEKNIYLKDREIGFNIEYPISQQHVWNEITNRIANSFRPTAELGI